MNNSIVFTDSIPLLAISFKALSAILPETFQFLGLWALLCFIFQAWFSWKLISLFIQELWFCSICTELFIFSARILGPLSENPTLGSFFLILAALYLALKNSKEHSSWQYAFPISEKIASPESPKLLGMRDGNRELGIGIKKLEVR